MSRQVLTTFTRYELTTEEQLAGQTLSLSQKLVIQNEISIAAEKHLALTPEPNNYNKFIQEEAYLKGQIDILKYLLDCSTSAEQAALEAAQAAAQ